MNEIKLEEIKSSKPFSVRRTKRSDGYIISTIELPYDLAWYGRYETALVKSQDDIRIIEGYSTRKEAIEGHEKYCNMTTEELEGLEFIG